MAGSYNDGGTYHDNLLSEYHKELGHDVTLVTSPFVNVTDSDRKRIIYAVGYIGLLLLPIFYVDSFLKLQNRAVIAYYFYFIGLIPIAILCDKATFMKTRVCYLK